MFRTTRNRLAPTLAIALVAVLAALLVPGGAGAASAATHPVYASGGLLGGKRVKPRMPARRLMDTDPTAVDLSAWAVPVGLQGGVQSCVTWAIDYAMVGWYMNHDGRQLHLLNPMYTFSQIKQTSAAGQVTGSSPSDAINVLQNYGNDTMEHFADNEFTQNATITAAETANAANYKVVGAQFLVNGYQAGAAGADAIKHAIATGHPVAILLYYNSGLINLAAGTYDQDTSYSSSNHEVLAVGYNASGIKIQNSWGTKWADGGFGWLSWSVVQNDVISAVQIDGLAAGADPDQFAINTSLQPVSGTTQSATFTWPSSDASGISSYVVQLKTDGSVSTLNAAATSNQTTQSLSVGHSYQLQVMARDSSGNLTGYWYSKVITPTAADTTKPSVTAATPLVPAGAQLGATVPIQLRWTASDSDSGLSRSLIWKSVNGSGYTLADTVNAPATTDTLQLDPGNSYSFIIRAVDVAGNYSDSAPTTFRLDLYQETANGAVYSGVWSPIQWTGVASGGTETATQQAGASVSFTFTGKTVAFVGPTFSSAGSVSVYMDGVYMRDTSFAASSVTGAVIQQPVNALTSGGLHTLKLVTDSAQRVDIDAFVVLS